MRAVNLKYSVLKSGMLVHDQLDIIFNFAVQQPRSCIGHVSRVGTDQGSHFAFQESAQASLVSEMKGALYA